MSAQRRTPDSSFRPVQGTPVIDPAFRGIAIATRDWAPRPQDLTVHGVLLVPEKDFDPGARILDAVALVATFVPPWGPYRGGGTYHFSWMPFRERLVLDDDVQRSGGFVRAYFNTGFPEDVPVPAGGRLFLLASVGRHVSEVLTVKIG